MVALAGWLAWLHRRFVAEDQDQDAHDHGGGGGLDWKRATAWTAAAVVVAGAVAWLGG